MTLSQIQADRYWQERELGLAFLGFSSSSNVAPATDTLRWKKGTVPELRALCTDSVERLPLHIQFSCLQTENIPYLNCRRHLTGGLAHSECSINGNSFFFFLFHSCVILLPPSLRGRLSFLSLGMSILSEIPGSSRGNKDYQASSLL